MPPATRFLQSSAQFPDSNQSINLSMDSDVVVVLASLLCAVICILGLALVARCAWLRQSAPPQPTSSPRTTNRGIKKKVLNSLPTVSFDVESAGNLKLADCAICLAEFEDGELVRVLPPCGHGFHVGCIDTWLGAHSSCPSCREVLVVAVGSTCRKCGAAAAAAEGDSRFLP